MKISIAALREWVEFNDTPRELGDRLTMAGFELESLTPAAPPFSGVRVAQIIEAVRHPQADKLQVCRVAIDAAGLTGEGALQIVCGAANARAGLKTALAMVGAELPGGLHIKAAKLRGVESAGMLCSAKELGLAETSEGILELPADAPLGQPLREYMSLDDTVLELAITPNRGDAMSTRGIAREVAALCGAALREPHDTPVAVDAALGAEQGVGRAMLQAAAACPRFHSRLIVDLDNTAASPLWLREQLRRAGLRSISPVVDVTNLIVHELGQPMHAYDADLLRGPPQVRFARDGETIELLDGRSVTLQSDELVIADAEGAVALAGIMGGARTAVSSATQRVLFEVAWFAPSAIAGRARRHGLTTDASQRFERGVDPQLGAMAIERASQLLQRIAGGRYSPLWCAEAATQLPPPVAVTLRHASVARLLGVDIPAEQTLGVLQRLGLRTSAASDRTASEPGAWCFDIPSHRFDLRIERDLIEEVARIWGYERIAPAPARSPQMIRSQPVVQIPEQRILDTMTARGFLEGIHFAFVDPALQSMLFPGVPVHTLANPISSELAVMRTSLWPGLIKAALDNQRRQQSRIKLCEQGVVFPVGGPETRRLAALLCGTRWPEQWGGGREAADIFDLRADLESVLSLTGDLPGFEFVVDSLSCLHPGRTARLTREGKTVGWLGELHPELVRALGFAVPPCLFEIDVDSALAVRYAAFEAPSRFPQVRRDLAFIVEENVAARTIIDAVESAKVSGFRHSFVFDVYRGAGIETGRKSVALGLILQDKDRTLTDEETDRVVARVRDALRSSCGAVFRE
ncbi:MAG: phenylalanine--tRNA ligase subunit beta [Gammaproteobacteria bacterium]|nr:phenylalanine--tRNA ligase subunit beta [Gammaproteobacteria bacterium]